MKSENRDQTSSATSLEEFSYEVVHSQRFVSLSMCQVIRYVIEARNRRERERERERQREREAEVT